MVASGQNTAGGQYGSILTRSAGVVATAASCGAGASRLRFWTSAVLRQLEQSGLNYIVVARLLPTVRRLVSGLSNWVELDQATAVAECEYQMGNWAQSRRLVVVRHRLVERAGSGVLLEVPSYGYSLYLTNLALPGGRSVAFISGSRRQ